MEKRIAIERLAFIKCLFDSGVSQSRLPEPMRYSSILSFQDSIELFLGLAKEELKPSSTHMGKFKPDEIKFMQYWELDWSKTKAKELTHRDLMTRLNRARVNLKHHGVYPASGQIDEFRYGTHSFLNENSRSIFELDFDRLSMVDLVSCESAKEHLIVAERNLAENKIPESLAETALSFYHLLDDYETRKRDKFSRSPFSVGPSLKYDHPRFLEGLVAPDDFFEKVRDSVVALQETVKVLEMGFDYRKYARFKLVTPGLTFCIGRKEPRIGQIPAKATEDDCRFCINFVIECALRLQEFDFEVAKNAE